MVFLGVDGEEEEVSGKRERTKIVIAVLMDLTSFNAIAFYLSIADMLAKEGL